MTDVVTGEAVQLELRVARLGSRTLALIVDFAAQGVLFLVIAWLLSAVNPEVNAALAQALAVVVIVGVVIGYPVVWETLWRGQTPGKAMLGIRVVRDDGGPVRFRHALGRALIGAFVERPGITFGSGAVICSLLNRRGKRLGDLVSGTMVLQERVPAHVQPPVFMPPQLAAWAATLDLSRLSDGLALAARDFVGRAHQLAPASRETLGTQLVNAVAAAVSPPPPPGTPGWAYLAAVLAERRRRDEARLRAENPAAVSWVPAQPSEWTPPPPANLTPPEPPTSVDPEPGGFVLPN